MARSCVIRCGAATTHTRADAGALDRYIAFAE
jgi:hypothetical protein